MRSHLAALAAVITLVVAATCLAGPQSSGTSVAATAFDPSVARPMTAEELKKRMDAGERVVVVDGREDLAGEIVKGAVQVTEEQLVGWSEKAPKDVPLVFYCTCPDDEIAISDVVGLQNLGVTNAYYLKGGLDAARKAGIPVVAPGK
jgi:rhodanese-related sulfurtransferase